MSTYDTTRAVPSDTGGTEVEEGPQTGYWDGRTLKDRRYILLQSGNKREDHGRLRLRNTAKVPISPTEEAHS